MADKAGLTYGRVTGRFEALVADSPADAGENPDVVPLEGTITFTPLVGPVKLLTSTPPSVMVPTAITGQLDADGDLSLNGVKGLYLVATDGPTSPNGWIYRVQYNLTYGGVTVDVPSIQIAVPGGTSQDIVTLLPVSGGGNVVPQPLTVPQQIFVGGTQPVAAGPAFWLKEVSSGIYELVTQTLSTPFATTVLDTAIPAAARTDLTGASTISQAQGRSAWLNRRLTGNVDLTVAAGLPGMAYSLTLDLTQDGTGGRTLRLINVHTEEGMVLPISSTANARTLVYLVWNGFVWTATLGGRNFAIPTAWVV